MAKFADYATKVDEQLDQEIDQASQESQDRRQSGESGFEIPERFKGKSAEEIARSYAELEKAYSRQGNDLGRMRQTLDEYIDLQLRSGKQEAPADEERKPITIDDLYENTDDAIRRGVEAVAGDKISALEQELARAKLETRLQELDAKHEGWRERVQSPEFQNWVLESPYRTRLAKAADSWDLDAAEDLLSLYDEVSNVDSGRQQARREQNLRDGTLESAGADVERVVKPYSRSDLLAKRVAAMRGDKEARAYLATHADAIANAYESGNITD